VPRDDSGGVTTEEFWLGRLHVRSAASVLALPQRDYLVKGLISPGEMSVWWGPPKSGKSFLVLYVTYAVAQGRSVYARRVHRTPVVYLAAEGASGLGKRVKALTGEYGIAADFYLVAQGIDLLQEPTPGSDNIRPSEKQMHGSGGALGNLGEIISLVRSVGAKLVVVDTLNRALRGGDENNSKDMGAFIANVTTLIEQTGAHVLVIHHGTKSANSTPRGHSSLIGAADLVVEIARVADGAGPLLGAAKVTAAKDDADGIAIGFSTEMVRIGTDADGDAVTTLLVKELAEAPSTGKDKKKGESKEARALGMLRKLTAREGCPQVKLEDWKQLCLADQFANVKPESAERSWRRLKEGLEKSGRVVVKGDLVRVGSGKEVADAGTF
jgi:AAA domain